MITFAPSFTGCPDGGIGRRAGLKHQWIHFHAGSTPALGTLKNANNFNIRLLAFFVLCTCTTIAPLEKTLLTKSYYA